MTTVVPTSEEDPALAVVRFTSELAWADAGPEVPTFFPPPPPPLYAYISTRIGNCTVFVCSSKTVRSI